MMKAPTKPLTALSTPAPAPTASSGNDGWPPALRIWVERAFAQCKDNDERKNVEKTLRQKIQDVTSSNSIWSIDWDTEPLPDRYPRKELWLPPRTNSWGSNSPWAREQDSVGEGKAGAKSKRKAKRGAVSHQLEEDPEERSKRTKRAGRFESSGESLSQRMDRWSASTPAHGSHAAGSHPDAEGGEDFELDYTVVGTCQKVYKKYLRLTSAPDPAAVRPEPVLRQAVAMVQEKYDSYGDERGQEQYIFLWEQMKSIRQDLTVQRIRNGFTVEVYEMHARICLEFDDQTELKQCQAQLTMLYEDDLGTVEGKREFTAYNILYNVGTQAYNNVNDTMLSLTAEDNEDKFIAHSLQVRAAATASNYAAFFHLYAAAPGHSQHVMDTFADRERLSAVRVILKAYAPSVPVEFVSRQLAFDEVAECAFFLTDHGVVLTGDGIAIDCKASKSALVEHSISQKEEEVRKAAQRKAERVPISFS